MCDALDYALGVVLGQKAGKESYTIHYASKLMNEAQLNYTTTKKELLTVVFALDNFDTILLDLKSLFIPTIQP